MKAIKRGALFYADLNPVCGSEQSGIRPVLIVQNNTGNRFSPTTIVAAVTGRHCKNELPVHVSVFASCLKKPSTVLLEHVRTIDKSRLFSYIGQLDEAEMKKIDRAIGVSFGLKYLEVLNHAR